MRIARPVFGSQGIQPVLSQHQHHGLVAVLLAAAIAEIASIAVVTASEPRAIWFAITGTHWRFSSFQSSWFAGFFLIAVILCIAMLVVVAALLAGTTLRFVGSAWFRAPLAALAVLQMMIAAFAMKVEPWLWRDLVRLDPFPVFFVLTMVNAWLSAVLFIRWKSILRT